MQKRKTVAGVLAFSMMMSTVFAVPGTSQAAEKKLVLKQVKGLKVRKKGVYTLALKKGESYKIKVKGNGKNIIFTSSKKKIAAVSKKGVIAAKKEGKAVIRVKSGKGTKKKQCQIQVTVATAQKDNGDSKTTVPTIVPTTVPDVSALPVVTPTGTPRATVEPTVSPTGSPTNQPTTEPTNKPTTAPTPTPVPTPTAKPDYELDSLKYTSLSQLAQSYEFKFGTVVNPWMLMDSTFTDIVKHHFNSVTASNEMKAYSLLSQWQSQQAYKDADSMPVMNYTNADKVMDFAKENGIAVRGHTLVWDASMCDWFFREGYTNDGAYVDQETMKKRLQYYIEEVVTHFEENYPGVIYCWDVVNEAVSGKPMIEGDERGIETNIFSEHVGSDYVELSFQYTYEAIQKIKATRPDVDIKLFYNDFSTFYGEKRDAICALVQSINQFLPDGNGGYVKLCDGVGMQSYIGGYGSQTGCMNDSDLELIRDAITKFHSLGVEVHVTELAVRNYKVEKNGVHGTYYGKLFNLYKELNEGEDKPLTSISIWGLMDNPSLSTSDYNYRMNGPYCGIFNENYEVKPAFLSLYKALGGSQ